MINLEELLSDHGNLLNTLNYLLLDELASRECLESTEHYAIIDFVGVLRKCADDLEVYADVKYLSPNWKTPLDYIASNNND